jgi:hypothetical protein
MNFERSLFDQTTSSQFIDTVEKLNRPFCVFLWFFFLRKCERTNKKVFYLEIINFLKCTFRIIWEAGRLWSFCSSLSAAKHISSWNKRTASFVVVKKEKWELQKLIFWPCNNNKLSRTLCYACFVLLFLFTNNIK